MSHNYPIEENLILAGYIGKHLQRKFIVI